MVLALGGLVLGGVEEGARIGGPGEVPTRRAVSGRSVARCAGRADVERVLAVAGGVGGVGEQVAVGADGHGADVHEGFALGERVDVEDRPARAGWDRRGVEVGVGGGAAAVDGVLAAFDGAGEVEPVAQPVGDGFVGLLDVGEHLGVELGLEVCGGRHEGGGVGVLGVEVGEELRASSCRASSGSRRAG